MNRQESDRAFIERYSQQDSYLNEVVRAQQVLQRQYAAAMQNSGGLLVPLGVRCRLGECKLEASTAPRAEGYCLQHHENLKSWTERKP